MQALVIERGESEPRLLDVERPEPGVGEALVRTVRVGIDGTDVEVIAGKHGHFPPGSDYMILGHEAVGVVESVADDADLSVGQPVVPTVRRPAGEPNENFRNGEGDMSPPGDCIERGIAGAHGYMAEYFTAPVETLVPIPRDIAASGYLVEPLSVVEKAIDHASAARSAFQWNPDSAFVLGAGPLGLLGVATFEARDLAKIHCLDQRRRPDRAIDILDRLGAVYVDAETTPLEEFADTYEPADIVVEATGHAPHAVEAVSALAPNGVAALLGLPESHAMEFDVGTFHRELVMSNRALVGSVNANVRHYRAAVDTLADLPAWLLEEFDAGVFDLGEYERAFQSRTNGATDDTIKTAVEFDTL